MLKYLQIWKTLKPKINTLSSRERLLLFITGGIVIWILMDNAWVTPLRLKNEILKEQVLNLEEQNQGILHQYAVLKQESKKFTNPKSSPEYQNLETTLLKNHQKLKDYRQTFLFNNQLPVILENLLGSPGLNLLKMEIASSPDPDLDNTGLTHQKIKMTFIGEYESLLKYIKKVEALSYPIYWETLEYKVEKYPEAKIQLEIDALSADLSKESLLEVAP